MSRYKYWMSKTIKGLPYKKGYHRHHVIPLHAGGKDEASNMVYVTREEHVLLHEKRYAETGDDADRRAVLLLRMSPSDRAELAMWRSENNRKAALAAHEAKIKNGFYNRLGALNSDRMRGKMTASYSKMTEALKDARWWTDGNSNRRVRECPGEGWTLGRSKRKHHAQV